MDAALVVEKLNHLFALLSCLLMDMVPAGLLRSDQTEKDSRLETLSHHKGEAPLMEFCSERCRRIQSL
jgi:hypothetical protein